MFVGACVLFLCLLFCCVLLCVGFVLLCLLGVELVVACDCVVVLWCVVWCNVCVVFVRFVAF